MRHVFGLLLLTACQPDVDRAGDSPATQLMFADPEPVAFERSKREAPAVAPLRGGGLIRVDSRYVAVDPDGDRLVIFRHTGFEDAIALPPRAQPFRLTSNNDFVFASLVGTQQVGAYRIDTPQTIWEVSPCVEPRGVDAYLEEVYVACASGEVVVLDAHTGETLRRRWLGTANDDLRDVVIRQDGLYLTRFRSAEVLFLDRFTLVVRKRRSPKTWTEDTAPFPVEEPTRMVPAVAWRAIPRPEGGILVLHQRQEELPVLLTVPEPADRDETPPSPYGANTQGPHCMGILHSTWTEFTPEGDVISGRVLPGPALAVDVSLENDRLLLASTSSDDELGHGAWRSVERFGPKSCATDEITTQVHYPGQVTSVDGFFKVTRMPFRILDGDQPIYVPLVDDRPEVSSQEYGWRVFHTATASGLSCASCHPEGGDDGHVWTFDRDGAIEMRRTPTFGGVLEETAPYHWDAEFAGFDDLVVSIFEGRMGGSANVQLTASSMREWLGSLQPRDRFLGHLDPDVVASGKAVFEDPAVACAECHLGYALTNNESEDVGTGRELQVPTLRGLSTHGPWMHDGCATTLEERFDPDCGGPEHGGSLTPTQTADLLQYLQTL